MNRSDLVTQELLAKIPQGLSQSSYCVTQSGESASWASDIEKACMRISLPLLWALHYAVPSNPPASDLGLLLVS